MNKIDRITITVNRACNLRCSWCYASETNFDKNLDMTEETFDKIVEFAKNSNVKKICIIGGEPTIFPNIYSFLKKLDGFYVSIVSNGICFENLDICKKYIRIGVKSFSISVKAENKNKYKETTSIDAFNKVLKGIENLISLGANVCATYVITNDNINNVREFVSQVKEIGCNNFFFSFCRNYDEFGCLKEGHLIDHNPLNITREFEKLLPWLKRNIKTLHYSINDPLCIYSDDFLEENLKHFLYPCYVHTNNHIVFDTDGYVIPCNTIYQIKVGKIGEDFNDFKEFCQFQNSDKYTNIYKKLKGFPNVFCKSCKKFIYCQGRCICNWTNYSFELIQKLRSLDCRFANDEYLMNNITEIEKKQFLEIKSFDPKKTEQHEFYKVIIGISKYNNKIKNLNIYNKKTIYNQLTNGNVAFFTQSRFFTSSVVNIMNLLTCSPNFSYKILDYFGKRNKNNLLVEYLLSKGFIFVNLDDLNQNNIQYIVSKASCILICGYKQTYKEHGLEGKYNSLISNIKDKEIPAISIKHPSSKNSYNGDFVDAWIFHDDNSAALKQIKDAPKLSIVNFILK